MDFRYRPRDAGRDVWFWTLGMAALGLLLWASPLVLGDATDPEEERRLAAEIGYELDTLGFVPPHATPFESLTQLGVRDLGRLVYLRASVRSRVRSSATWVQTSDGRHILVRFEPEPRPEDLRRVATSGRLNVPGYLEKISRAEFEVWMDSLGVWAPKPPPGRKFGDLPDPAFAQVDSLFIRNFYISVRPEALRRPPPTPASARQGRTEPGRRGR